MENFTLVPSLTLNMGFFSFFFLFLLVFEEVHVCFCCMNVQVTIITARKYIWVCRKWFRIAEAGEMNIKLVY